ncbi:MAG: hypothetical protein PHE58_01710 [Candidatus Omnitrophica bacterium]|nr:hypothetical protein [Candidatus Omnitrophota bacterium]
MKNLMLMVITGLIVLLAGQTIASAESFTVSCTIPAIPGVNAPAIAEDTVIQKDIKNTDTDKGIQEEDSAGAPTSSSNEIQQEESRGETQLANSQNTVQTIYVR